MEKDWQNAMAAFYANVDKDIDRLARDGSVRCRGCGQCCHFDTAGHLLYASRLEKRYLLQIASRADKPDGNPDSIGSGDRCPYQQDGQCHARTGRVLGCRLHFCQWPDPAAAEDMAEQWHGRLKQVHDDLGEEWEYQRLLPLE